jgi:hypothetical protein
VIADYLTTDYRGDDLFESLSLAALSSGFTCPPSSATKYLLIVWGTEGTAGTDWPSGVGAHDVAGSAESRQAEPAGKGAVVTGSPSGAPRRAIEMAVETARRQAMETIRESMSHLVRAN